MRLLREGECEAGRGASIIVSQLQVLCDGRQERTEGAGPGSQTAHAGPRCWETVFRQGLSPGDGEMFTAKTLPSLVLLANF